MMPKAHNKFVLSSISKPATAACLLAAMLLVTPALTGCSVQQTQSVAEPFITGADRAREAREQQDAHNINGQQSTNKDVEVGILTTIMAFLFSGLNED
ncbi:hypothetical protein AB4238_09525 [Shewanella sp. 10N.286.45.A1]|uniref:hypothetical protein n=1 Tax=Shewanella sp. 10N.286.45.A1 TaxID=3229694 RepID=UPI00354CE4B3